MFKINKSRVKIYSGLAAAVLLTATCAVFALSPSYEDRQDTLHSNNEAIRKEIESLERDKKEVELKIENKELELQKNGNEWLILEGRIQERDFN